MKRSIGLLVAWLCLTQLAQGQERKLHFGVNLFPNVTIIQGTDNQNQQALRGTFIGKPSFAAQVTFEYDLAAKVKLLTGVGFQNTGEKTEFLQTTFSGTTPPNPAIPISRQYVIHFRNLEIPVGLKYYWTDRFYSLVGGSALIHLSRLEKITATYNGGREEEETRKLDPAIIKEYNLAMNLGFGFHILNKAAYSIFLQPSGQMTVFGVYDEGVPLNRRFLSLGLATGVRF